MQKKATVKTLYSKFKQGDVVFGLDEPRSRVCAELRNRAFTHTLANELNSGVVNMIADEIMDKTSLNRLTPAKSEHYTFLSKHQDYLRRVPGKTIPTQLNHPGVGAAYRRACKLLLINRDTGRTSNAHVVTTGIDWDRVCNKDKTDLGVTNSEMRAAYRDYCEHGKNPHIFFYDEDLHRLKHPPWTRPEIKEQFDGYDEKRLAKYCT